MFNFLVYYIDMERFLIYLRGGLIGMIAEYCFRVELGYLEGFILTVLIIGAVIDIVKHDN